jgi:hypothetical protein
MQLLCSYFSLHAQRKPFYPPQAVTRRTLPASLRALGVYVLVEMLFRAGQQSIPAQAALAAHEAGRRKWNVAIRPSSVCCPPGVDIRRCAS